MISVNRNTTLVLGAGASKPYRLPLGVELRDLVLRIPHNASTAKCLAHSGFSLEELQGFRDDLERSGYRTVDHFLEVRPKWMDIGKLAMAIVLLNYEQNAPVFPPNQPADHWYEELWQKLRRSTWNELKATKIRVITFNYDRTLEYYLCGVITNNLGVKRATVMRWLAEEFVVHPHGTLGDLSVDEDSDTGEPEEQKESVRKARESMVVISQANPAGPAFSAARERLKRSDVIVFLGFGFHDQNMQRLGFPDILEGRVTTKVRCMHKGFPKDEWQTICARYFVFRDTVESSAPTLTRAVSRWVR